MPHLLWIMFGIIVLACLATYLIPAGEFAVNEAGQITGTDFHFLDIRHRSVRGAH